jgi:6-phosphogluconolactonase
MNASIARTHIAASVDSLAGEFVDWLVDRIEHSTGPFAVALSGGSTPRPAYALLASPERARRVDWSRVHLFWGDERFVPYDHPDSNYRMVKLALIDHVPIPSDNVHPVPVSGTPVDAAQRYARELQRFYGSPILDPARPLFGVNLLGMGDDGHTASLFPGIAQLEEKQAWTVAVEGVKDEARISLTFPVLASAGTVAFLVAGSGKAAMVTRAFHKDPQLPSGRIRSDGELIWFLDSAAASDLDLKG